MATNAHRSPGRQVKLTSFINGTGSEGLPTSRDAATSLSRTRIYCGCWSGHRYIYIVTGVVYIQTRTSLPNQITIPLNRLHCRDESVILDQFCNQFRTLVGWKSTLHHIYYGVQASAEDDRDLSRQCYPQRGSRYRGRNSKNPLALIPKLQACLHGPNP